jgi:hypothetical protein
MLSSATTRCPDVRLMVELVVSRTVHRQLPAVGEYPDALSETVARRWSMHADFSLIHARMRSVVGASTAPLAGSSTSLRRGVLRALVRSQRHPDLRRAGTEASA